MVDYSGGLLAPCQGFGETGVDAMDIKNISEDGANESIATGRWDDIAFGQGDDPELN